MYRLSRRRFRASRLTLRTTSPGLAWMMRRASTSLRRCGGRGPSVVESSGNCLGRCKAGRGSRGPPYWPHRSRPGGWALSLKAPIGREHSAFLANVGDSDKDHLPAIGVHSEAGRRWGCFHVIMDSPVCVWLEGEVLCKGLETRPTVHTIGQLGTLGMVDAESPPIADTFLARGGVLGNSRRISRPDNSRTRKAACRSSGRLTAIGINAEWARPLRNRAI